MRIKWKIIELCDDMIEFWDRLRRKLEQIPNENEAEIVLLWNNYFPEYSDTTINLINTKIDVETVEEELIEKGILKYDT